MDEIVDRSCWTCQWQNIGAHDTLLGYCGYPSKNNPERKKAIPGEHVDRGCKFWEERTGKHGDTVEDKDD